MVSALTIFTKVPIPGLVKTRLTQNTCLTKFDSAKIAESMLKDTLSLISKVEVKNIQIGYFPSEHLNILKEIIKSFKFEHQFNKPIDLILQKGSNFDQRFASIVEDTFKRGIKILIILGADLPFLDPDIIKKAFENLTKNFDENPIIIGPSSGGGIYLVGITNQFRPNWFSEYNLFSNGLELSKFSAFCKQNKFPLISLPPYGDIDIEEDLVSLISYIEVLKNSKFSIGFHFPHYTAKIIEELKLYVVEENHQTRRRNIAKRD